MMNVRKIQDSKRIKLLLNKHKSTLDNHKNEHNLSQESSEEYYKEIKQRINEWKYEDELII